MVLCNELLPQYFNSFLPIRASLTIGATKFVYEENYHQELHSQVVLIQKLKRDQFRTDQSINKTLRI